MTYVKICGLTTLEDARFALQTGADLLGFIFYEPSPRYVSPERVRDIVLRLKDELKQPETRFVGVFVNHKFEFVQQTLDLCRLDLAQLHGDEPPEWLQRFDGRAFKALNPRSLAEAEAWVEIFAVPPAPFIMVDAYHPILRGGTGHTADWSIAAQIAQKCPLLLSGGLNPNNVTAAIRQVNPWGVDVSSGVEAHKGKKDWAKVKAFIENVRGDA